jgi:PTS system mannose-specific IIA component
VTGIILVCHGDLGRQLVKVAESIVGETSSVRVVSISQERAAMEAARKEIEQAIRAADSGGGVLILTDMFGGTPSNFALSFLADGKVEVVTGVNLPMLIKALSHRERRSVRDLAGLVRDAGVSSIIVASALIAPAGGGS